MPSDTRVRRVAERIRTDLSEILLRGAADPRLAGVTLTDVEVDRELAFATIYVTALQGEERRDEVLAGLKHASVICPCGPSGSSSISISVAMRAVGSLFHNVIRPPALPASSVNPSGDIDKASIAGGSASAKLPIGAVGVS